MAKYKFERKDILIGSDPEFAVSTDGLFPIPVSVIGKLGGNKAEPMDIGEGCGLQEDNVMAELTMPPCKTFEEFYYYINYGKCKIEEIIFKNTGQIVRTQSWSSAEYSKDDVSHPVAQKFGCEPSFCIYTKGISPRPSPEEVGNLRSAGFHIHMGIPKLLSQEERIRLIFCCDLMLGIPSIILDTDNKRRKLYGNAGDFRAKLKPEEDYTIMEYRTLGAAMHGSYLLLNFVWDQTQRALQLFLETSSVDEICKKFDISMQEIRSVIDEQMMNICEELIETLEIKLPENARVNVGVGG